MNLINGLVRITEEGVLTVKGKGEIFLVGK